MPPTHPPIDVWSLAGTFAHWIYGPKGEAQGLLLDVGGVPVQFVVAPHELPAVQGLGEGDTLVLEGHFERAAGDNPAGHDVYRLVRVAEAPGARAAPPVEAVRRGRVLRFNFAKHGEANGVVLDSGDFIHTKPHGMAALGLKIGDAVVADGPARPLFTGSGMVVEAQHVNGQSLR